MSGGGLAGELGEFPEGFPHVFAIELGLRLQVDSSVQNPLADMGGRDRSVFFAITSDNGKHAEKWATCRAGSTVLQ